MSIHENSVVAIPEMCIEEHVDYFSGTNNQNAERAAEFGYYYPSPYLIKDEGGYLLNIHNTSKYSFDALYIYNKVNKKIIMGTQFLSDYKF